MLDLFNPRNVNSWECFVYFDVTNSLRQVCAKKKFIFLWKSFTPLLSCHNKCLGPASASSLFKLKISVWLHFTIIFNQLSTSSIGPSEVSIVGLKCLHRYDPCHLSLSSLRQLLKELPASRLYHLFLRIAAELFTAPI